MALRVRSGDTFGIDPILLDGFLEFLRSPVGLEVLFRFVIACGSTINLSALQSIADEIRLVDDERLPLFFHDALSTMVGYEYGVRGAVICHITESVGELSRLVRKYSIPRGCQLIQGFRFFFVNVDKLFFRRDRLRNCRSRLSSCEIKWDAVKDFLSHDKCDL